MNNINERIKNLYKEQLEITAAKFGKEIGSNGTTIANIVSKTKSNNPSWDIINKIATRYDGSDGKKKLSMEWLMRGDLPVWMNDKEYNIQSDSKLIQVMEEKEKLYKIIIRDKLPEVAKNLGLG